MVLLLVIQLYRSYPDKTSNRIELLSQLNSSLGVIYPLRRLKCRVHSKENREKEGRNGGIMCKVMAKMNKIKIQMETRQKEMKRQPWVPSIDRSFLLLVGKKGAVS